MRHPYLTKSDIPFLERILGAGKRDDLLAAWDEIEAESLRLGVCQVVVGTFDRAREGKLDA